MNNETRLIEIYKQRHYDSVRAIIRRSLLVASVICCAAGIAVTAATGQQMPMFLYIAALVCMSLVLPLWKAGMLSQDTAVMIPTLFFCFVYTPVSWFVFGGLLGCMPYLSVVFIMIILLAHYRRWRGVLLGTYTALLAGLMVYSVVTSAHTDAWVLVINTAAGYVAAVGLVTFFLLLLLKRYDRFSDEVLGSAITDELTGMLSRRVVGQVTALSEETYKKHNHDYMVLMLDIDRLKKLNSEYGRVFGDEVLKSVAECIRENIRSTDYAIRSGDDEFLIVLTDAAPDSAESIIMRLDKAVKATLALSNATASRGCVRRSECREPGELVELADRRMTEQKSAGKDAKVG